MAEGEHPNCQAIEDFLNAIPSVSRPILKTQQIDEGPVHEGYTASWHDSARQHGFTALAWDDGKFLAVIDGESHRRLDGVIADAGRIGAKVNKLMFGRR